MCVFSVKIVNLKDGMNEYKYPLLPHKYREKGVFFFFSVLFCFVFEASIKFRAVV